MKRNLAESNFQEWFIKRLRSMFPGSIVTKNDPNFMQGIPDVLLLWRTHWAAFECKSSARAPKQPNQEYYVTMMDAMSFSAFVYPENAEEVLHAVQLAFQACGPTRVSKRQQVSLDKLRRSQAGGSLDKQPGRQTRNRTPRARASGHSARS